MADSKALKRTLMDVRKMRRSVRMRKETDPEVVSQTLETILKEAIALSAGNDGAMSKAALKEIKQVRRALIAQQIDAGQNTAKHIGIYSAVLDSVEGATADMQKEESSGPNAKDEVMSSFQDSLPSSDTMISAIMTANPVMGYTMKITRDLMGAAKKRQKENKERSKKENQLRLEKLKEQERLLSEDSDINDLEKKNAEDEANNEAGGDQSKAVYQEALESIRDEIRELNKQLNGQSDSLEKTSDEASETSDTLERIYEHDKDEAARLESEAADDGLKRQESKYESGDDSLLSTDTDLKAKAEEESGMLGGIFSKIAASIGGVFGIGAGAAGGGLLATLIKPFKRMFGFLKKGGKILLKFGKFTGILGAVMTIYDFVQGFTDAANIAGKKESELTMKDKINAGFSNLLSGLLAPIDWISEALFGEGLMGGKSREELNKQYFDFFDDFGANIIGMGGWIMDMIVNKMTEIKDGLSDYLYDLMPDWAKSLLGDDEEKTPEEKAKEKKTEEDRDRMNRFRNGGRIDPIKKDDLKGSGRPTSSETGDRVTSAMDKNSADTVSGGQGGKGGSIFAPTSSNTNVNQHQYMGNGSSENKEPTHRRFSNSNIRFGFGP